MFWTVPDGALTMHDVQPALTACNFANLLLHNATAEVRIDKMPMGAVSPFNLCFALRACMRLGVPAQATALLANTTARC